MTQWDQVGYWLNSGWQQAWHWLTAGIFAGGLLDLMKALAAPIIALAALRVSKQQVYINASKLRLDMYEKRLKIYKAVRELCECLVYSSEISPTDLAKFRADTLEADFLFDDTVCRYVREVGSKARQHIKVKRKYDVALRRDSDDQEDVYEQLTDLDEWLTDQITEASEVFKPFLAPEQRDQRHQKKKPATP